MKNVKVSIIIPAYNAEKYIDRCVQSAVQQSLQEIEIIIIDDGSTDQTYQLCSSFNDERIRVMHQENAGPAAARNKGLDFAMGEYIGFLDSDDYIAPEMFEFLYTIAKQKNADIVYCSHTTVSETKASVQNTGGVYWIQ